MTTSNQPLKHVAADTMDKLYLGLEAYLEMHNKGIEHTQREQEYNGINLYKWIQLVISLNRRGLLEPEMVRQLDEVGFCWRGNKKSWEEACELAGEWVKLNPTREIKRGTVYKNYAIGAWYGNTKRDYLRGELSKGRQRVMERAGIPLESIHDLRWQVMYEHYEKFINGTLENDHQLRKRTIEWQKTQRANKRNNTLSEEREHKLNAVGFIWDAPARSGNIEKAREAITQNRESMWESYYALLKQYQTEYGNVLVMSEYKGYPLHNWVQTQRRQYTVGNMSEERINKLEAIGFIWSKRTVNWLTYFALLNLFKSQTGHTNVKNNIYIRGWNVGAWIRKQRDLYRFNKLSSERIALLNSIGFDWKIKDKSSRQNNRSL